MSIEWVGTEYGGWVVDWDKVTKGGVVFDCGVGKDLSFAERLIEVKNCKVFAFDPTSWCIEYWKPGGVPDGIDFREYGIWKYDCRRPLYPHRNKNYDTHSMFSGGEWASLPVCTVEFKTLRSAMKDCGVNRVDYLKLCFGGDTEYDVIEHASRDGWLENNSPTLSFLNLHFSVEKKHATDAALRQLGYKPLSTLNESRWTYVR